MKEQDSKVYGLWIGYNMFAYLEALKIFLLN